MKKFLASILAVSAITAVCTSCKSAPTRTAEDLANAVFESIEWVSSEHITDAETAKMMVGLDTDLCEEYVIYVPLMSVHLDEIVIVKPKAGKEGEVQDQLDEHYDYIKESAAFYPAQEIAAAGAVKGKTDDGFYYVIVHEIGSQIADVIKDYRPGDEVPKLELPEDNFSSEVTVPTDELGEPFFGVAVELPGTADAGNSPASDGANSDGVAVLPAGGTAEAGGNGTPVVVY